MHQSFLSSEHQQSDARLCDHERILNEEYLRRNHCILNKRMCPTELEKRSLFLNGLLFDDMLASSSKLCNPNILFKRGGNTGILNDVKGTQSQFNKANAVFLENTRARLRS